MSGWLVSLFQLTQRLFAGALLLLRGLAGSVTLTRWGADYAAVGMMLAAARYERRSLLITANTPFGEWNRLFPDPAMTVAAIDRLVHHATIFEMNVESFRRRTAINRRHNGPGRPPTFATPKNVGLISPSDNQPEN